MVGTNLKGETFSLKEKRDALETEMDAIISRLCQPGGPGISGNLLDSEGFPRSDIDIPSVRADRHRLVQLRNDYKDITEKINENLQVLHSAKLSQSVQLAPKIPGLDDQVLPSTYAVPYAATRARISEDVPSAMDEDPVVRVSFAMVDEIADTSPAAEDGLQIGDEIVKFGSVEIGEELLPRLASEAQSNQGRAISLIVMRQGAAINLTVTPRPWRGRGLLGCHFRLL